MATNEKTWVPTSHNVYARRKKAEDKVTEGGIIVPGNEKANHDRVLIDAEIIAIGAEVTEVAVGDRVVFPRYEAWPMEAKNAREDDLFFVAEKHIYGKLSPDAEIGEADAKLVDHA
jgi:co-chaperonin GroES (HSP10)